MAINIYKHIDNASAGGGNGTTWALSGANAAYTEAELEVFLESTVSAGDVIFIKGGTTLTLDSDIDCSSRAGTDTSPIAIIGVKSTTTNTGANVVYTDWASDTGRPFIDCATYLFKTGDDYYLANVRMQGEASRFLTMGSSCIVRNCKFDQDYASSASREAVYMVSYSVFVNNEVISANTKAVNVSSYSRIVNCYFNNIPDPTNGIALKASGGGIVLLGNIFNNCKLAYDLGVQRASTVVNNTFYKSGICINATSSINFFGMNNILEASTTKGFLWTTQTDVGFFWDNHGDDTRNTDMWDGVSTTTVFKDHVVTTGDPLFVTSGSDFKLQIGSPCLNTGTQTEFGV